MNKSTRYSPEARERAVRMDFDHQGEHESQWAAIESIAAKIGCTAETLRKWVRPPLVAQQITIFCIPADRNWIAFFETKGLINPALHTAHNGIFLGQVHF